MEATVCERVAKPAVSVSSASCGHLYHLQCLQQKECVWGVTSADPQQRWSCYKCSSSRAGKGGPAIEPKRGRTSTQAQVRTSRNQEMNYTNMGISLTNRRRVSF